MRCRAHRTSNHPTHRDARRSHLTRRTSAHTHAAAYIRWPSRRAAAAGAAAALLVVCMAKGGPQKAKAKAKAASQNPTQALHQGVASGEVLMHFHPQPS